MHTKPHRVWVSAVFFVTLAFAAAGWAATDSTSGTWKMNPEKSKYDPGPAPKSVTTVIDSDGTSYKVDAHTVNADGTETHISFDAKTDGQGLSGHRSAERGHGLGQAH
jgi:hypothetical protein